MFVSMVDSLILLFLELKFLVVVWQSKMKSRNEKDRNHMPDSKGKIHELKNFDNIMESNKNDSPARKEEFESRKGAVSATEGGRTEQRSPMISGFSRHAWAIRNPIDSAFDFESSLLSNGK